MQDADMPFVGRYMNAEGVGFEPTVGFKPTLDFESSALNRTQPPFRTDGMGKKQRAHY